MQGIQTNIVLNFTGGQLSLVSAEASDIVTDNFSTEDYQGFADVAGDIFLPESANINDVTWYNINGNESISKGEDYGQIEFSYHAKEWTLVVGTDFNRDAFQATAEKYQSDKYQQIKVDGTQVDLVLYDEGAQAQWTLADGRSVVLSLTHDTSDVKEISELVSNIK